MSVPLADRHLRVLSFDVLSALAQGQWSRPPGQLPPLEHPTPVLRPKMCDSLKFHLLSQFSVHLTGAPSSKSR